MIFIKRRQIIPQNEALGISFSKKINKGLKRSTKGQQRSKSAKKGQKSQISELMKRTQITHQNEALSLSRSEKLVLVSEVKE